MMSALGWQSMQSRLIFFVTVFLAAVSIATVAQDKQDTQKAISDLQPSSAGNGKKTGSEQLSDAERAKRISEVERPIEEQFFGDSKGKNYLPVNI